MAMGWLKGLVAPAAQFAGQQLQQQGMPQGQQQGGPPMGGAPPMGGTPYGVQPQGMDPSAPPIQPQAPGFDPSAMQWSTGTKTQGGAAAGVSAGGPRAGAPSAFATTSPQTPQSLEARCAQLQHDVESLALFARTLLTMLEEAKVVTREQFDATKHRLDMLDGKLDDR
jgi:hypothetical protein